MHVELLVNVVVDVTVLVEPPTLTVLVWVLTLYATAGWIISTMVVVVTPFAPVMVSVVVVNDVVVLTVNMDVVVLPTVCATATPLPTTIAARIASIRKYLRFID